MKFIYFERVQQFIKTVPKVSGAAMAFCALSSVPIQSQAVTAQQFVDLQEGGKTYPGYRRAHAKGICIEGVFRSNGQLADYTFAPLFREQNTAFSGRFSIAGGNPYAPDLKAPVRSLALNFVLSPTNVWRIAMNTPPVMAVTHPADFYQQIQAIKKGPAAIKTFFEQHPESRDFLTWKAGYQASHSFANETYHSINAFYLLDEAGNKQAVRWALQPLSEAAKKIFEGDNALQDELKHRLSDSAVVFDWVFTLATEADDETNPAKRWPADRTRITAGQIVINDWTEQLKGECHSINFDPLVLPAGIQATADPILRARSAAYAESYRRRAKEQLSGALEEHKNGQ